LKINYFANNLSIIASKAGVGYAPERTSYSQVALLIKTLPGVPVTPNVD
jgi:hypothetical protein